MKQRANLRSPLFLQYASRPAEAEATNQLLRSEEFDNSSWIKSNTTITVNQVDAPDGTLTADKLTENSATTNKFVYQNSSITADTKYTMSVFAKSNGNRYIQLAGSTGFDSYAVNYDLQEGVIAYNPNNIESEIEDYGNGWFRISYTDVSTPSGAPSGGRILITLISSEISARAESYLGDGVSGVYIWGAQLEQGEYTSYIKTEGSTETRTATTAAQEQDVTAELRIYNGGGGYNYERTNSLSYSEDFSNGVWSLLAAGTGSSPSVTSNYSLSPNNDLTADRVILDQGAGTSTGDYSIIRQIVSGVGQGVSTVYMKSNTNSNYVIGIDETGTGTKNVTVTPNWQRFEFSDSSADRLQISLRGGTNSNYADISVWGAQLEVGTQPTSYIKTEATAVTELAYQTEAPTEATYTLTRTPNNTKATFEVSELVRDYIEQTTENTSGTTWLEVTLSDSVQLPRHYHFLCTEGYLDNTEGLQTYLNAPSNETFMQSNSTILIPEGESLELPINAQYNSFYTITTGGVEGSAVYFSNLDDNTTQIEYITVNSTDEVVKLYVDSVVTEEITIQETECSKFANNKLLFVNKYGAKQEFYANMKSTEKIRVKDDGFKRNVINYDTLSIEGGKHSYKRRVNEAKESHTLNTPFLDEENVQAFEELLLSEYVWYKKEGGNYIPVIIKDSSMTRKTHLNDKLIQYTIEVESADELINTIR